MFYTHSCRQAAKSISSSPERVPVKFLTLQLLIDLQLLKTFGPKTGTKRSKHQAAEAKPENDPALSRPTDTQHLICWSCQRLEAQTLGPYSKPRTHQVSRTTYACPPAPHLRSVRANICSCRTWKLSMELPTAATASGRTPTSDVACCQVSRCVNMLEGLSSLKRHSQHPYAEATTWR